MKNFLPFVAISLILLSSSVLIGQTISVEIPIIKNGEMATDTLDNGQVVEFALSSDDAEQENDEMDTLHDDDIDAGWEGDPEDLNILTAGLRFQTIPVPKGATIESAHLIVNSHEAKAAEDVAQLTIVAHKHANAPTFSMDELLTDLPVTNAQVAWEVAEEWGLWTDHQSIDFAAVVQEIIDMDDWAYGNSIAILIRGEDQGVSDYDNAREFEAFENIADPEDGGDGQNHPERVPRLVIEYSFESTVISRSIVGNGEMAVDTLDNGNIVEFELSADDAEQENDEMDTLHDDDIDAGWEGDPEDLNTLTAGLRFQNISIPKGVSIDSAFLILNSHESKAAEDVARITIAGIADDNADTFSMDQLLTDLPQTNATILWEVAEEWGLWTYHQSINIAPVIQEIIDRENWETGNAVGLLLLGEDQGSSDYDNAREFEAFENIADPEDGGDGQNHPERVPQLVIYYSGSQSVNQYKVNKEVLEIYPNPVSGQQITIRLRSNAASSIRIFDQSGRMVKYTATENSFSVSIDTRELPKGIYTVKAVQDQTVYTQKLILN